MPRKLDLKGQKFGRLTVLEEAGYMKSHTWWYCECECGTWTLTSTGTLRNGKTKSCGCLAREVQREVGRRNKTHGLCGTYEHTAYYHLKSKGEAWCSFTEFMDELGKRPSENHHLDKRDHTQPHGPNNTYWRNDHEERDYLHYEPPCINLRAIIRAEIAARKGEEAERRLSRAQAT